MTGTIVYKKNKNMVTRKIADETILLPIYRTSKEINCIYTLNKPASIVWDMIDGKTTIGEIKDKVLNNGFDLIKDSAYRIKDSAGKKKEPKAKSKEGKAERERERGAQRDTLHAMRAKR
ncbi:MAG: PqqD family protein [Candidatus Omnitrophica bacterium]|nr:PqqD family protein [Candidatus Omnitrophota bacterium]